MSEHNANTPAHDRPADLPELNDVSQVDDQVWPLTRAVRNGSIAVAALIVVSLMFWGATNDLPGLWGALIGGLIGGSFMLLTVWVVLLSARTTPTRTLVIVLGSWLLKMAVFLGIMIFIQDMDFYYRPAFAVTTILAMIAALATETYAVTQAQRLYVG
ncbi:hypothetical protein F7230_02200 [Corynebacterium sp. 320]|uniref:ATP synthase protein I n=1 Tax=Corynebacterium zhongnanshanii TaxID=2768834 RepID=A0ABQ6VG88_9CORY|nr:MULTISPECIES: hypothetical protein [Corynebacterium]KAB1503941.1 hypothetical protein F7230_02200 [Corynebacterium sp. 320]KAB1552960.1 hypothetical protein F7233_04395 [Corynebacterium sp. 321]KAB1553820.1 hypothetical protein F7232_02185 [Corynebacterium sp. 319]KAB3523209.1 hypothetical protein F8377_03450 [Corynebacterium zhongnanshanii]KAB3528077.1 hypothetical protein F8354_02200 [Corynebacterium sp. 250]